MSEIEMAASDAAADVLSLPHEDEDEALAQAQDAAYRAAVSAGATPVTAAAMSLRVVAHMAIL